VSTVKVAARAATFTVLTIYNITPQYRNQPHPTLPAKTHIAATFTVLTPYNIAPQHCNQPHPTLPAKIHMQ